MKKGLIFLLGIMSFLGVNSVSADSTPVLSNYYDYFEEYIEDYNTYKENIDYMINYWEENYSQTYPYYAVVDYLNGLYTSSTGPAFKLYVYSNSDNKVYGGHPELYSNPVAVITYQSDLNEYFYSNPTSEGTYPGPLIYTGKKGAYQEYNVLISHGLIHSEYSASYLIPTFYSENLNISISEIKLIKGINFPGLIQLKDGTYNYNINELAPELELEDVISSPLDALTKVKDTIVNIFNTISEFISLLPDTMQTFLYLSFSVAIILGLLKIIL